MRLDSDCSVYIFNVNKVVLLMTFSRKQIMALHLVSRLNDTQTLKGDVIIHTLQPFTL